MRQPSPSIHGRSPSATELSAQCGAFWVATRALGSSDRWPLDLKLR
jgi:hypothetical protein